MKERPILFSSSMVRAILDSRKTMTRRGSRQGSRCCPYGGPGDRLWVREAHARFSVGEGLDTPVPECVAYRATCDERGSFEYQRSDDEVLRLRVTKWTPGIHMPRWASRITLEITGVRVERLQAISEEDARAEGIDELKAKVPTARDAFRLLWDDINGKRRVREYIEQSDPGYTLDRPYRTIIDRSAAWEANPWVWVIEFKRIEEKQ